MIQTVLSRTRHTGSKTISINPNIRSEREQTENFDFQITDFPETFFLIQI